jgi:hypothetical protein
MWRTLWPRSRRIPTSRRPARYRPRIEVLETRWVPSTLTVTTTADSGPGSLRAELAVAKSGDTIVFDPSLNGQTINLTSGELDIKKSVTIQGPGAGLLTISGDNLSRVFEVEKNTNVVLSGMTLTGGDGQVANGSSKQNDFSNGEQGVGGAILNTGGNLTVSKCTLSANSALDGGGIGNGNGQATLTVSNCNITGNSATIAGGGIVNYTSATVSNCTISGNSVTGSSFGGGGIFDAGPLTVSNSTISGNSAGVNGGGLMVLNLDGTLPVPVTVSGCTVSGNSADIGAGIFYRGESLTVSDSAISGNSAGRFGGGIANDTGAGTATVSGCTVTGNSAGISGGGIYSPEGVTVSTSFFSANSPDNITFSFTDGGGNTFA